MQCVVGILQNCIDKSGIAQSPTEPFMKLIQELFVPGTLILRNPSLYTELNTVALVRKRTIPTERPPLVGEVSANFCGKRVLRGQSNEFPRPLISVL
jgi:hypothetical protein